MKKILIILFLLFAYEIKSNNVINNINIETYKHTYIELYMKTKANKIKEEIKYKDLIKEIEYESEIHIPKYVDEKYIKYMYYTADSLKIPIRLAFRLIFKESNFKVNAVSPEGAKGFMQVMPKTYNLYKKRLNLDNNSIDNNCKNILVGMILLKDLYHIWVKKGNETEYAWKLALASYNTGIANVMKYNGIPSYVDKFINYISNKHTNENV